MAAKLPPPVADEDRASEQPGEHRPGVGEQCERDRDPPAGTDVAVAADRDEAHEHLRRAEKPETDRRVAHERQHVWPRGPTRAPETEQRRIEGPDRRLEPAPAKGRSGRERQHDQSHEHDQALHQIRPGDREKSAGPRIGDDDAEPDEHAGVVVPRQEATKRFACGVDLRTDVDGDEAGEGGRRDPSEHARPALRVWAAREASDQIIRDGDRVVAVGGGLERSRHQEPPARDTEELAGDDPQCGQADRGAKAGQAEIEPGRLAGRARGERGNPGPELLAADVVVTQRVDAPRREESDQQEDAEVGGDDDVLH